MKRPLAAVVSFYAAGLLLAEFVQLPLPALFSLSFGFLAFALFFPRIRPWLIWPLLLLVGWSCPARLALGRLQHGITDHVWNVQEIAALQVTKQLQHNTVETEAPMNEG
jgi:hypothetical protein